MVVIAVVVEWGAVAVVVVVELETQVVESVVPHAEVSDCESSVADLQEVVAVTVSVLVVSETEDC